VLVDWSVNDRARKAVEKKQGEGGLFGGGGVAPCFCFWGLFGFAGDPSRVVPPAEE